MAWVLALIGGTVGYALCDGVMSAIRDIRTRETGPPYKDFYHLCLHAGRALLLLAAFGAAKCCLPWWQTAIIAALSVCVGDTVWHGAKCDDWFWLALDDRIHASTGWRWLDKKLGLHW